MIFGMDTESMGVKNMDNESIALNVQQYMDTESMGIPILINYRLSHMK